jgi:hypothetical protein
MSNIKSSSSDASAVARQPIRGANAAPGVPLVIGVTGHRDLRGVDEREVARAVREVFRELRARYPQTPLVLLSPLNEGADRLAARVAHDEGLPIIAVLPWPEGVCDEYLHRSGERSEFDRLLRQADNSVFMPLLAEASSQDLLRQPTTREQHYAQTGAYLARHCQILIALWDGNDCENSATANVVRWQREGATAPFAPEIGLLDSVESGPVVHIVMPGKEGEGAVVDAVERRMIYPTVFETDERAQAYFHDLWSRIDQFNADAGKLSVSQPRSLAVSQDSLLPPQRRLELDDRLERLLVHYAAADCAAAQFQAATRRTAQLMFVLVGLAVVAFEFYAHLLTDHLFLLAAYLLLLVLCAGLVSRSRRSRLQEKYIDYRALAEALRVQFFWRLAGRTDSVADYYLRTFRSELDWICQAARACHLTCGGHSSAADPANHAERLRWVLEHWAVGQAAYFGGVPGASAEEHRGGRAHREEQRHRRFERVGAVCFVTAIALAAALFLVHWKTQHPSHLLVVVVFLTATGAALVHEYGELSGCAADATRYKWAAALFRIAAVRLRLLLDQDETRSAQQLIGELGREALAENGDWVRQHRLKPLKTPAPA